MECKICIRIQRIRSHWRNFKGLTNVCLKSKTFITVQRITILLEKNFFKGLRCYNRCYDTTSITSIQINAWLAPWFRNGTNPPERKFVRVNKSSTSRLSERHSALRPGLFLAGTHPLRVDRTKWGGSGDKRTVLKAGCPPSPLSLRMIRLFFLPTWTTAERWRRDWRLHYDPVCKLKHLTDWLTVRVLARLGWGRGGQKSILLIKQKTRHHEFPKCCRKWKAKTRRDIIVWTIYFSCYR